MLFLFVVLLVVMLVVGYPWIVAAGTADRRQEADHRDAVRSGAHPPPHLVGDDRTASPPAGVTAPRNADSDPSSDDSRQAGASRQG